MGGRHPNGKRDNGPRHRYDGYPDDAEAERQQRERELKRTQDENRQLRAEVQRLSGMVRVAKRVLEPVGREHDGNKTRVPPHRSTRAWGGRARKNSATGGMV